MTVITRVGHCSACYRANRPKTGQIFIVFGGTSDTFKSEYAERNGKLGYTPHIYELIKVLNNKICYRKICCMVDCGAYIETTKGQVLVYLDETKWDYGRFTIPDWNALVRYKDETFRI